MYRIVQQYGRHLQPLSFGHAAIVHMGDLTPVNWRRRGCARGLASDVGLRKRIGAMRFRETDLPQPVVGSRIPLVRRPRDAVVDKRVLAEVHPQVPQAVGKLGTAEHAVMVGVDLPEGRKLPEQARLPG